MCTSWLMRVTLRAVHTSETWAMSTSPTVMVPAVGRSRPDMRAASVDLPAPDAPTRAVVVPAASVRSRVGSTGSVVSG